MDLHSAVWNSAMPRFWNLENWKRSWLMWSHLVWSWSPPRRLGSLWCCLCTGCPQETQGCTAERGSGGQRSRSLTTRTTRTSCLQRAERDTHADTGIKEFTCSEWERNSLYFWVRTESLLPSYHHLAGASPFIPIKQRQFGFGRSLWTVGGMVNLPQTSHGFGFCHGLCVWKWEAGGFCGGDWKSDSCGINSSLGH